MDRSKYLTAPASPRIFPWGDPQPLVADVMAASQGATAIYDVIESLPYEIAVVDRDWNILAANNAWLRSSLRCGAEDLITGGNYRGYCQSLSTLDEEEAESLLEALDDLSKDRRDCFYHRQVAECDGATHTFRVYVSRMRIGGAAHASITRDDISELINLRDQCEMLSASMLGIEESERRRIGRELHDSTAQLIVALQLDVMRLKQLDSSSSGGEIFEEISETIQKMHAEIRATSYVLHPPDHHLASLEDALTELAAGFGQRTGLKISMRSNSSPQHLPAIVETVLYRIAQEALVNVHRHARATEIAIFLAERRHHVHLMVHDNGVGLRDDNSTVAGLGVGIPGMRERMAQLRGRLSIFGRKNGTCLVATVPVDGTSCAGTALSKLESC